MVYQFSLVVFLLITALASNCWALDYTPTVHLKNGVLRGLVQEVEDQGKAFFYQGIKYGRATRFSKPTAESPWSDVLNATSYQFACVQSRYPISETVNRHRGMSTGSSNEDCLYLNLWRPAAEPRAGHPRAVMVFFYGGSFTSGTIFDTVYDSRILAAQGDLIVITVNYRLGAFGFLYGGTEDAPGNAGLYDQILALQWVHENVASFGGDPDQVTVFGQSAGSMSVSSLILSPLAKGLFHQAILESGVANSYFGSDKAEDGLAKARILGGKLACPVEKMPELVACLRGKSAQEIQKHSGGEMANGESFVPVYGTELLPLPPVQALKEGKVNRLKSLLYGVTRDEGSGFIARLLPVLDPDSDGSQVHVQTVKTIIKLMFQMFKVPYYTEVAEYYTKNLNESDKTQLRRTIGQAFADYHLVCPTVFFGEALAAKLMASETYSYRLMLPTSIGLMGCRGWMGVCHGEDLIYVMGISQRLRGIVFTEAETSLSLEMIKAWTNFAKHGNPGTMGERKVNWSQAVDGSHQYTSAMELDAEKYQMVENYYETVCNSFWKAKIFV